MNTIILLIAAVAVALLLVELLREVLHDGPTSRPPQSHREDPMFRSPAAWS